MTSFVKTQADWRHADEGHQFKNLSVCGGVRHSVAAYNFTAKRILSPRSQRFSTAVVTFGRAVESVLTADRDKTKFGRFCWTKLGGSGKKYLYDDNIHVTQQREH